MLVRKLIAHFEDHGNVGAKAQISPERKCRKEKETADTKREEMVENKKSNISSEQSLISPSAVQFPSLKMLYQLAGFIPFTDTISEIIQKLILSCNRVDKVDYPLSGSSDINNVKNLLDKIILASHEKENKKDTEKKEPLFSRYVAPKSPGESFRDLYRTQDQKENKTLEINSTKTTKATETNVQFSDSLTPSKLSTEKLWENKRLTTHNSPVISIDPKKSKPTNITETEKNTVQVFDDDIIPIYGPLYDPDMLLVQGDGKLECVSEMSSKNSLKCTETVSNTSVKVGPQKKEKRKQSPRSGSKVMKISNFLKSGLKHSYSLKKKESKPIGDFGQVFKTKKNHKKSESEPSIAFHDIKRLSGNSRSFDRVYVDFCPSIYNQYMTTKSSPIVTENIQWMEKKGDTKENDSDKIIKSTMKSKLFRKKQEKINKTKTDPESTKKRDKNNVTKNSKSVSSVSCGTNMCDSMCDKSTMTNDLETYKYNAFETSNLEKMKTVPRSSIFEIKQTDNLTYHYGSTKGSASLTAQKDNGTKRVKRGLSCYFTDQCCISKRKRRANHKQEAQEFRKYILNRYVNNSTEKDPDIDRGNVNFLQDVFKC